MNQIDIEATHIFSWMYKNECIKITILLALGLYFIISPKLSNVISLLYNNIVFRILIISLILFFSVHDIQLAIMVTLVYLVTLTNLNNPDKFTNIKSKNN
jgi:hypothetical protein